MLLPLAFLDFLGFQGIIILTVLGVLLYGERLPEVAASLGKQLIQLKKSFQGIRSEFESVAFETKHAVTNTLDFDKLHNYEREEATAPKFEPPPMEPAAGESILEPPASPGSPSSDKS